MSSARPLAILPILPGSIATARTPDTRPLFAHASLRSPRARFQSLPWSVARRERAGGGRRDPKLDARSSANEESNQPLERESIELAATQLRDTLALNADERRGVAAVPALDQRDERARGLLLERGDRVGIHAQRLAQTTRGTSSISRPLEQFGAIKRAGGIIWSASRCNTAGGIGSIASGRAEDDATCESRAREPAPREPSARWPASRCERIIEAQPPISSSEPDDDRLAP